MPPKFAQDYRQRERSNNPEVPLQPSILSAAEAAYKVNHALPPRSNFQPFPKSPDLSNTTAASSNSNPSFLPYRQRLVAAALASSNVEDPHSSNDSSSAPSSSKAVSSNTSNSTGGTSSGSPTTSKGKVRASHLGPASNTTRKPIVNVPPSVSTNPAEFDPDASYYDLLMTHAAASLPEPGPSHFEKRRALWTAEPPEPIEASEPSPSRVKLEALLGQSGAVESDEVWRAGLKNVWKGLIGGNQLRQRLPLAIVLKILQAGWLRDGTWPEGLVAPSWGDEQQSGPTPESSYPTSNPAPPRTQEQQDRDDQRRTHEEEAYAAATQAHEHASGSIQMHPYAQMHIMGMGMGMGIPPGYSPSSGDAPEETYYGMPYAYAEATPPPEEQELRAQDAPACYGALPPVEVESEMDTDEEGEAEDVGEATMEGLVYAGDGRHEGG